MSVIATRSVRASLHPSSSQVGLAKFDIIAGVLSCWCGMFILRYQQEERGLKSSPSSSLRAVEPSISTGRALVPPSTPEGSLRPGPSVLCWKDFQGRAKSSLTSSSPRMVLSFFFSSSLASPLFTLLSRFYSPFPSPFSLPLLLFPSNLLSLLPSLFISFLLLCSLPLFYPLIFVSLLFIPFPCLLSHPDVVS